MNPAQKNRMLFTNWFDGFRIKCRLDRSLGTLNRDLVFEFIEDGFWDPASGIDSFPDTISFHFAMDKIIADALDLLGLQYVTPEQRVKLTQIANEEIDRVQEFESELVAQQPPEPWRYEERLTHKQRRGTIDLEVPPSLPDKFRK